MLINRYGNIINNLTFTEHIEDKKIEGKTARNLFNELV